MSDELQEKTTEVGAPLRFRLIKLKWRLRSAWEMLTKDRVPLDILFRAGMHATDLEVHHMQIAIGNLPYQHLPILYRWIETVMDTKKRDDTAAAEYLKARGL